MAALTPEECAQRRLALGLTAAQLARLAGLVERTVTRFESREVAARPGTLIALRKAFRTAAAPAPVTP